MLALTEVLGEIPPTAVAGMRVPARVFADAELLAAIERDRSLEQLANVATLPGIVDAALAMPDIHQGYGFPVGGIAATAPPEGVISPGGVGYDINCGVRLLAAPLTSAELGGRPAAPPRRSAPRAPASSRARRSTPPTGAPTWARWPRPRTSPGPTATRSPTTCAARSRRCWATTRPAARGRSTTSPTTSPSSRSTADAGGACTARAPPAPSPARRCSSPARWARRATCWP